MFNLTVRRIKSLKPIRYYLVGRTISNSAVTIRLEDGQPNLPIQVERIALYSGVESVVTSGVNTEIPRIHTFDQRWIYKAQDVILDSIRGDVYLDSVTRIYESSNWHPYRPEFARTIIPRITLEHIGVATSVFISSWTYFHFLIENLPAFLAANLYLEKDRCLIYENAPRYVFEALELLSITPIRVGKFADVEEIVFCGKGSDTGWMHPRDLRLVRESFGRMLSNHKQKKVIYVSRVNSSRTPENEVLLENRLNVLGVKIVYAEKLSFADQIRIFSSANKLIGLHGAGLANQIWMGPNSKVFEIIDINYFNNCFEVLSSVCRHTYDSFIYDSKETLNQVPVDTFWGLLVDFIESN